MKKLIFLVTFGLSSIVAFSSSLKIVSPSDGAIVPTLTESQKAFVTMPLKDRREKFRQKEYRSNVLAKPAEVINGKERKTWWPKTTRLEWDALDGAEYVVKVVEASTGKLAFEKTLKEKFTYVDNLKIATDYKWTVSSGNDSITSTFKTEDIVPRILRFPGVPNVRDLGGYMGLNGKRVKQGLIYRSAAMNDHPKQTFYTKKELFDLGRQAEWEAAQTNKNKKIVKTTTVGKIRFGQSTRDEMLKYLGFKTDIDLRNNWETSCMTNSPLGSSVNWVHASFGAYGGIHNKGVQKNFKKIFKLMLEEENYPFILHCYAGQDRTGTLTYVLLALLGVSDDNLSLDWSATGFWNRGSNFNHKGFYDNIPKSFSKHGKGTTAMERAENFVRKIGFTNEDIAKFRSLMLE
jgi:protein-tyrosine phosphatase